MGKQITIVINTGNDAMKTPEDVALVLEKIAGTFRMNDDWIAGMPIYDTNGQKVGRWIIKEDWDHG